MPPVSKKSLLEVQFSIGQLSLESYLERDARTEKILNSLGKWWGTKPIVLTRSVILGSLFEASDDPDRWPEDLEIFLKLLCFDNAGMWKRRNEGLKEQRKGRVQRGTIGKRIPFCNLRYDEGVEQRLFNVLTGRIQEITNIFGTVPDFITDRWVEDMLEKRELSESDLVTLVSDQKTSPFSVKETYEYPDEEWENTAEVLNSREAISVYLNGW